MSPFSIKIVYIRDKFLGGDMLPGYLFVQRQEISRLISVIMLAPITGRKLTNHQKTYLSVWLIDYLGDITFFSTNLLASTEKPKSNNNHTGLAMG